MSQYRITVNGKTYDVNVEPLTGAAPVAAPAPAPAAAPVAAASAPAAAPAPAAAAAPAAAPAPAGGVQVCAPMPGKILRVLVNKGDAVKRGDNLMILEAMKMENEIPCDCDGTVLEVRVSEGSAVNSGDLLAVIG